MTNDPLSFSTGSRFASPADGPCPPVLIGRDAELEELTLTLSEPPALAVVDGEAGVGKTRLVHEALARPELEGRRVVFGHCQPLHEPLPFGPVIEALRGAATTAPAHEIGAVAGALVPLVPELSEQLPPALEPLGDVRADRHRVFRAILEVLRALGPTICVLEDMHWADDGTGDLLRFLVSQLPDELALVLTYRREDLPPSSPLLALTSRLPSHVRRTRLALSPLGVEEMRKLVASTFKLEDVSEEFVLYLHERTQGLPFAVEEVLRLLADRRDIVQRDGRWARKTLSELGVPAETRDAVLERLARLCPDARRVVRAAAIVGVAAPEELLRSVAGLTPERAARGLSEALSLNLLREAEEGRFNLRHVLASEAVYEATETPERRRLHLRAARALERQEEPPLARMAHHFEQAGVPKKWVRYAEAAADLAISLGNQSGACELLAQALGSPKCSSAARARMAVKLGRAALGSLDHAEALTVLRPLLDEDVLPMGVRGEMRLYVGLLLHNQAGEASSAYAEIARAVPELRRRPGLAARAMAVLAIPMSTEGHLREHLAWMERALEAAGRTSERTLSTAVLVNRATLLMHVGDPAAWEAVLDLPWETDSPEETRELLRASLNLAHACTCIGHYAEAERFVSRGRELAAAEESDPYYTALLDSTCALLDCARGRWATLEAGVRRHAHADDVPVPLAEAELVSGLILLAQGEILEAERQLASARDVGWKAGAIPVVAAAAGGLARILLARGNAREAATEALSGLELVRRKGIWVWAAEVAPAATEALLADERKSEAARLVAEISRGLRGRDAPAAHAALAVCRALLARGDGYAEQGARTFARAERAWLDLPRPYEAARCREARALLLLSLGRKQGTGVLLSALEDFTALGARWDAARVRRSLREHGIVRPWRGGRKGYGSRLSPREEEVARLAAAGRTNKQIAEALVLSPRTVEVHLARARRKLGAGSRKELSLAGTGSES